MCRSLFALGGLTSSALFDPRGASDLTHVPLLVPALLSFFALRLFFNLRLHIFPSRVSLIACLLVATAAGGCVSHGATQNDASSDNGTGDGSARPCAPPVDPTQPFPELSATGCMDALAVTRFAAGAYRYEVNSPLWSDQADKERAFVLPPGGKIHVVDCVGQPDACLDAADDGKWVDRKSVV